MTHAPPPMRFDQAVVISEHTQSLDHLGPLFDPLCAPQRAALMCDAAGYPHAAHLKNLLTRRGVRCELWPIPTERGVEWATRAISGALSSADGELALNLGRGGGLLGLLAHRAFSARGWPSLISDGGLLYPLSALSAQQGPSPPLRLTPHLTAQQSLACYGVQSSEGVSGGWFEEHLGRLAGELLYEADALAEPLHALHRLADAADSQLRSPHLRAADLMVPQLQVLIERFERAGCCELFKGQLRFSSEPHRAFCAGGWLSLYAHQHLSTLSASLRLSDLRQVVDVTLTFPESARVRVDLACVVNERLYLIFCPRAQEEQLNEQLTLFKALKGAMPCEAILLGHRPNPLWRRADDLGVRLCPPEALYQLDEWFKRLVLGVNA